MLFAPRMKLLYTLLGHANQITVVPVRIIGVTGKMGAQCLNTADGVTAQIDPVCCCLFHVIRLPVAASGHSAAIH
jgi:hypothetical protein